MKITLLTIAYAAALLAAIVLIILDKPYGDIPIVALGIIGVYQMFKKEQANEKAEIAEKKTEEVINAFEDVSQMKYEDYKEVK